MFPKDCTINLIHAFFLFVPHFSLSSPLALWCTLDPGLLQNQFPGVFIPWHYSAASDTHFQLLSCTNNHLIITFFLYWFVLEHPSRLSFLVVP